MTCNSTQLQEQKSSFKISLTPSRHQAVLPCTHRPLGASIPAALRHRQGVVVVAGVGTDKARRKGVDRTRILMAHSCLAQYLVSAHQEEVHSSSIDAVPLTQSR